jgi:hypothetical protein
LFTFFSNCTCTCTCNCTIGPVFQSAEVKPQAYQEERQQTLRTAQGIARQMCQLALESVQLFHYLSSQTPQPCIPSAPLSFSLLSVCVCVLHISVPLDFVKSWPRSSWRRWRLC